MFPGSQMIEKRQNFCRSEVTGMFTQPRLMPMDFQQPPYPLKGNQHPPVAGRVSAAFWLRSIGRLYTTTLKELWLHQLKSTTKSKSHRTTMGGSCVSNGSLMTIMTEAPMMVIASFGADPTGIFKQHGGKLGFLTPLHTTGW
jgi:hypothetical protein